MTPSEDLTDVTLVSEDTDGHDDHDDHDDHDGDDDLRMATILEGFFPGRAMKMTAPMVTQRSLESQNVSFPICLWR